MIDTKDVSKCPNQFFDTLIKVLKLKNDAALSRALEVAPPVISKIRHRRLSIGYALLVRILYDQY